MPLGEPEGEETVTVKVTALDAKAGLADAVSRMAGVSMLME